MLGDNVKFIARSLGFDDCRIAPVHRATHAAAYEQWIAEGKHGDMAWLARNVERRTDPALVLPGAQAVIVVALNYFQSGAESGIARYAWGDDYHDLMEEKLSDLDESLSALGGTQRVYVDTGPVLERDFATDAGLGWSGKSTIQIHPNLGNYFFLGEVLTTLALPPDPPLRDHCGKCVRCMEACPTQAITSPHHLDARRCLSYLTIEQKGPIPLEFRRALGHRIYGCDDCLAACPWNRFARESQEAAFAARPFVHAPLRDFLDLTDESFREAFHHSPIKRIKRPAFLRNVCVALGNTGTPEDLPALVRASDDPNPLIAEHAVWAISEIHRRHPAPSPQQG